MDNHTNTSGGANVAGDVDTGGGDFVGRDKIEIVLSSLTDDSFKILLSTLQSLQRESIANKQVIFQQHIEPTFQKLEQVHKDYEKTAFELSRQFEISNFEMSNMKYKGLIEWLMNRSLLYRTERNYLENIHIELDKVTAKLTTIANITQSDNLEIMRRIGEFSMEVTVYFTLWSNQSMYSHLIEKLITLIEDEDEIEIDEAARYFRHMVSRRLPSAWQGVVQIYLELRGLCLG